MVLQKTVSEINQQETEGLAEIEYEKVLEKIGFGKTQWIQLLISGLITLTSTPSQLSAGILSIASQCEFQINHREKGIMMTACVAGVFLSTYIWGYFSDSLGRRKILFSVIFSANFLQFLSMFATNFWIFNLLNVGIGICIGGVSASMYSYLSEFNTSKHRAVVINYSTLFVSVGAIYVPAIAWLVLSANWSWAVVDGFVFRPWRLIIFFNLLPGFIGALMLLAFPESPKFFLAQNKGKEALDAVNWICQFNTGLPIASILGRNEFILKSECTSEDSATIYKNSFDCNIFISIWKDTLLLFKKPHRTNFLLNILASFCIFFSYSGLQIWYPEIVNRSTQNSYNNLTVCEILEGSFKEQFLNTTEASMTICVDTISTETFASNMVVGVAWLIAFTIQGLLLNPVGRKNVVMAALTIGALSAAILEFATNSMLVLVLFCLLIIMPGCAISIMCGVVVDLVPTNLRSKAISSGFTLGRVAIISSTNLVGIMMEQFCEVNFAFSSGWLLVSVLLIYFLPI